MRRAARVIVVDAEKRVLLLHTLDPARPGVEWLELPGGELEAGESPAEAARRELLEETGLPVELEVEPVAELESMFDFDGHREPQRETIFAARVNGVAPTPKALEGRREHLAFLGHVWWSPRDALPVPLHPPQLPELLDRLLV